MSKFDSQAFLKNLTPHPGVYQMYASDGELLYIGKAKNLKKRVSSYFQKSKLDAKTASLVPHVANIEVIVANSENEALLLENNLIKKHRPRYNILFRDDKSYPYLFLSGHDKYPRLDIHRGTKRAKGDYFGPFPSATAVRDSLNILQKVFQIRSCRDSFFAARSRPCLQYQIKRCTGPCVNLISPEDYQQNVAMAKLFLQGKSQHVLDQLAKKMEQASAKLQYEHAARYRDQMIHLRHVQEQQYVTREKGDIDVLAAVSDGFHVCVAVLYIRHGRLLGNHCYFPKAPAHSSLSEVLHAFIPQYYIHSASGRSIPREIIINYEIDDHACLADALSQEKGRRVTIRQQVRGDRARWLTMAEINAKQALATHVANKSNMLQRYEALQDALHLDNLPQRLECFDISHTMGEATVASCVVFNLTGPLKSDYRRFNITNITQGDDYAAMRQAFIRRYKKLKEGEGKFPDILVIDGGKGQLHQAEQALEELQVSGVLLLAVAKGPGRKPGLESLFISDKPNPIILKADNIALHLIQQIRDEAHRFAITGHRQRRDKQRRTSRLEGIAGVGAKRRQALLRHFGGLQEISKASVEEIAKVPGVSKALAQVIYDALRG